MMKIVLFPSVFMACISGDNGPAFKHDVNSLGMQMVYIDPGEFLMGNEGEIDYGTVAKDEIRAPFLKKGSPQPYLDGAPEMASNPLEWDESPTHRVQITKPFSMASTPVTNRQFEQFRPEHQALRGKSGFSKNDDDAVLFVSWDDAVAFTEWLSKREGETYRLPTEAEWEYAARAGTSTAYFTGDSLPHVYWQHQVMNRGHSIVPDSVDLRVGKTPPNKWGLHDMLGLVEEWCLDWYGPYIGGVQADPVGYADGIARVTRGGSHSTGLPFLRSANRSAALPGTRSFLIGFRVVKAEKPGAIPIQSTHIPIWAEQVRQSRFDWKAATVSGRRAVFEDPRTYTRIAPEANGPLYFIHNHELALTALPNGDLLAIWFTTVTERGREMVIAGSRLRQGATEWDKADVFFHIPDRNLTGQALWWDGKQTVYHFSGVGVGDDWKNLSLVMRKSLDNGVTWSAPQLIGAEFGKRHQPIDAVMQTADDEIVLLCDASWKGEGGTAVHVSKDGGTTWNDPGRYAHKPDFEDGKTGAWIAGIHAGVVALKDGRWLALGRGNEISGKMPLSISNDNGKTWRYAASSLTAIKSAQRLGLTRLREGPLLLVSFEPEEATWIFNGRATTGRGMYAALSYDEGETWPVKKLITPGKGSRILDAPCNYRWGEAYSVLDSMHGELRGYLTVEQTPDGLIHTLSSGTYYAFNLKWITDTSQ